MKVLVIGGTGRVGVPLVAQLLERGVEVTVCLRSSDRAHLVPPPAIAVIADPLEDPVGAVDVFRGKDAVFMLNKASPAETVEGTMAVRLAREAGVSRFVYQTVHLLEDFAYLPHIASKLAIKHAIEMSGMEYTFIAPNHFFQNDELCRAPLLEKGLYLTPLGSVGCCSIDARDIAEAAAVVLTTRGHAGKTYKLVGPRRLTGTDAAAVWAQALGKDVRYVDAIARWQDHTRRFMPAWLHYDLSLMYGDFARRGMLGTTEDVEELTKLLERPPRSLENYAADRAAKWLA